MRFLWGPKERPAVFFLLVNRRGPVPCPCLFSELFGSGLPLFQGRGGGERAFSRHKIFLRPPHRPEPFSGPNPRDLLPPKPPQGPPSPPAGGPRSPPRPPQFPIPIPKFPDGPTSPTPRTRGDPSRTNKPPNAPPFIRPPPSGKIFNNQTSLRPKPTQWPPTFPTSRFSHGACSKFPLLTLFFLEKNAFQVSWPGPRPKNKTPASF